MKNCFKDWSQSRDFGTYSICYADVSSGARGLNFDLNLHLHSSLCMRAAKTLAILRRLARSLRSSHCDNHKNLVCRPITLI